MKTSGWHFRIDGGDMTRREIVSALARWTVPTVLTLSLGTRAAWAAASCPPCTKKVGGVCRSCTVSQILNCQCEPCLGPPYCPGPGPTSVFRPAPSASRMGAQGPAPLGQQALESLLRRRSVAGRDEMLPGFGGSARGPFGRTPFLPDPRGTAAPRSLYDRLRPFDQRR